MTIQHEENRIRGERAKAALLAYNTAVNGITGNNTKEGFDAESALTDLLTDLHHYADTEALPFYERYARSDDCYKEEIAEPTL